MRKTIWLIFAFISIAVPQAFFAQGKGDAAKAAPLISYFSDPNYREEDLKIKFACTPSPDVSTGKFTYRYIIENLGNYTVLITWPIMDTLIIGQDTSRFPMMPLEIKKGEKKEVNFESPEPPVKVEPFAARVFLKLERHHLLQTILNKMKRSGPAIDEAWFSVGTVITTVYLPESLWKELEKNKKGPEPEFWFLRPPAPREKK